MMTFPPGVRVWLATGHTDMRRGFPSLALMVQEQLKQDPNSGHLFIFRGRRGGLMKRAGVIRDAALTSGIGQFAVIQSVAPSVRVEVSPINVKGLFSPKRRRPRLRLAFRQAGYFTLIQLVARPAPRLPPAGRHFLGNTTHLCAHGACVEPPELASVSGRTARPLTAGRRRRSAKARSRGRWSTSGAAGSRCLSPAPQPDVVCVRRAPSRAADHRRRPDILWV
jgi:IS66 Orf2 like protein